MYGVFGNPLSSNHEAVGLLRFYLAVCKVSALGAANVVLEMAKVVFVPQLKLL